MRRRSWAALEDLSTQRELDRKIGKQRRYIVHRSIAFYLNFCKMKFYYFSVSLSSLESDVEDIFFDNGSCSNIPSTVTTPTNRKSSVGRAVRSNRYSTTNGGTSTGNVSTHSLNEADLQVRVCICTRIILYYPNLENFLFDRAILIKYV